MSHGGPTDAAVLRAGGACRRSAGACAALVSLVLACLVLALPPGAAALTLPPGFEQTTAISGLRAPTAIEFAPNGRVFVAEKSGIIKTFDDLSDPTATVFADLRTQVHNFSDRGLLSLALDPDFPAEPHVYVYYTHDAEIGGTAPRWGSPLVTFDPCPEPPDGPGGQTNGCVVSGRIARLDASGEFASGPETVLVEDFCQQFSTDTGGGLEFGADGYLYMSAGDGAAFHVWDHGQFGEPLNPCGDPPGGVGAALTPPTTEGGRLRAQDLRTAGDPTTLDGSLIRIDPATGEGVPGNPLFSSADPNERRILAHGLRNPFGLAIRPGTNEAWVTDRGHGYWSEVNRVPSPTDPVRNFGWPCYEGALDDEGVPYARIRPRSDDRDFDICEDLYAEGTSTTAPYWAYDHELPVVPGEDCHADENGDPVNTSITGVQFYPVSGSFPAAYRGALFFSDRWRDCIWAMLPGTDGLPDGARVVPFAQRAAYPIDLEVGPGGDLFYVDHDNEDVRRVSFAPSASNQAPRAVAQADPAAGNRPVTVRFDGTGSSDPDAGDLLTFAWDLDGDGQADDSTEERPSHTFTTGGTHTVTLTVTDTAGATATDIVAIDVASPPAARVETPAAGATWKVGDQISFSGSATDEEDGPLAAAALDWTVVLRHCAQEADCHEHELGSFEDAGGGTVTAPDHAAPGEIVIRLTATDSSGQTDADTAAVAPQTSALTLGATPAGASLALNGSAEPAPFTRDVVVGSTNVLSAPAQQTVDNATRRFASWSDGQAAEHSIVAPATPLSLTASYATLTPGSQTLVFPVEIDSYVDRSAPAANFGSGAALRTDDSPIVQQSYLRFLVAGLAGHDVQSARLRMRATGNTGDGPAVFGTSNDWTEDGITWDNRPAPTTGVVGDVGVITAGTFVEWDVTSLVHGTGPLSVLLASTSEDGTQFNSREVANPDRRPVLVVTLSNDSYVRPKSAAGMRVSLVPAYEECTEPNRVHGAPLDHGSCHPPAPVSAAVTVGTPDANGLPASSIGFLNYTAKLAEAGEADVALRLGLSDVRAAGDLSDYAGELQVRVKVRVTDRLNGDSESQPGTLGDVVLPATVQCAATAATTIGGSCDLATTLDALTPGVVQAGARSVWEMGQVEVLDGGADGDVDTPGNAVFARQGIFVP
jgi:glucose/arabinose dehydrogenase/PKD repeat protein